MIDQQIPRLRTLVKILLWVTLGIGTYLIWPNPSSAFYDDLCFTSTGAVGNCMANATPNCSVGTTPECVPTTCGADPASEGNPACLTPVESSFGNGGAPNARSMIHADSIYLLAKAVGLRDRAAYFIAAYADTPDKEGAFILMVPASTGSGYTACSDPQHATIALPGLFRGSATGTGIHFPTVTGSVASNPDPSDAIHEGVSRLRSWALGNERFPCLGGLTFPNGTGASLSYFSGAKCYVSSSSFNFESGKYRVNQAANVGAYQSGDQPFSGSSGLITAADTPAFADDLQGLLNASTGRLANGTTPVPLLLLKMGVYLHSLLDRVSHAPALVPMTVSGPESNLTFNAPTNFPYPHAYLHFEEVGIPVLSPRTETALNLAYDELATFARLRPAFVMPTPVVTPKASVVPPLVTTVLNQRSAADRLAQLETLSKSHGYNTLAGNCSSGSPPVKPEPPGRPNCGPTANGMSTCQ
jgi:hypothetical protein